MMKVFTFDLLFLLVPAVCGIVCLKARLNIDLRSVSSQPGAFRDQIQGLKMNMNAPSNPQSCITNISVSYQQQQLTIISDDTPSEFHTIWDYIYFDTTIWPRTNWQGVRQTEHSILAVYVCLKSDGCNKAGILNYLDWMISRDFDFFKISIVELLLGSSEASGLCYEGGPHVASCYSQVCQLDRTDNGKSTKMNCVTGLMASQSALRFQLRLSIAFHPTKRPQNVLQYTCKYNQCNGNRVLERMEALIDQIYNVTSIWEGMGYQKQPNTPTSSSQPTIASTLTTTSQLSNGLTTDERVSSATTEDTQETDIPSRMESEAMSTMEVATTYAAEMETTSIIEIEAIPMMEIDTTSNIHESEVHTELSTNPLPVSTDAVAETTTVEITLVDTSIQSSETISTATTTFDVITSDGVYLTDTEVIDSSTEPITSNDAGQIRSPGINMTVIVLVLSYLRLL